MTGCIMKDCSLVASNPYKLISVSLHVYMLVSVVLTDLDTLEVVMYLVFCSVPGLL